MKKYPVAHPLGLAVILKLPPLLSYVTGLFWPWPNVAFPATCSLEPLSAVVPISTFPPPTGAKDKFFQVIPALTADITPTSFE